MRRVRTGVVALLLVLVNACTAGTPGAVPSRSAIPFSSGAPSPSVAPVPSPSALPAFEASRAMRTVRALAGDIGPREDTDPRYGAAARLIAGAFSTLGYDVARQRVGIPAGKSAGHPVPSGETENVVATPPGYDPAAPHLLVGAHLDTVVDAPGANDNASGVAVVMELARLARLAPTRLPVVWVAFGGEERRVPGEGGATFGSRAYLATLSKAERTSLRGVVVADVVGKGAQVQVCSGGKTKPAILDAMRAAADALSIPARTRVLTALFSDHKPFEQAGIPVAWLYTGEFSEVHTPRDRVSIVDEAALGRVGAVAWRALQTLSP